MKEYFVICLEGNKKRTHRSLRGSYKYILILNLCIDLCEIGICSYKIATKLEEKNKHDFYHHSFRRKSRILSLSLSQAI